MLIIGGLVVVGVLALIGAVLLALGEGRNTRATVQAATQTLPAASQTSVSAPPAQNPPTEATRSTPESRDARPERTEPVLEAQAPTYSSGQFHELVNQLQKLHEQSKDMQARLGQLNEIAEHMEQRESDMVELPRARRVS
jgi:hypothetical protein